MELKTLIVGGVVIFTILVVSIILFIFLYQKRYYEHFREKEQLQSQFQQELLRTQLEIQEQTLKNISQEIHDNIGQVLSLAKLNLTTMDMTKQDELWDKMINSKKLVSKAIQDLRDLSRSLNTDNIVAMGLIRAIEYELELIRKSGEYKTVLDITGTVVRLDAQKELIIFRIVQEVVNNILKHAGAKTIMVTAAYDSTFELKIADDGNGFDLSEMSSAATNSLGLRNMQARAKMIGASFRINSIKGEGTEVIFHIPLNSLNATV